PRKYRFRLLNASNARGYHLTLNDASSDGSPTGRSGPAFNIIGTDGGFLPATVRTPDILIAPAERYDVIVDFSAAAGKNVLLFSNPVSKAPSPDGDDVVPANVMLFKVKHRLSSRDTSSIPSHPGTGLHFDPRAAVKTRDLILSELDSAAPFENPIIGRI